MCLWDIPCIEVDVATSHCRWEQWEALLRTHLSLTHLCLHTWFLTFWKSWFVFFTHSYAGTEPDLDPQLFSHYCSGGYFQVGSFTESQSHSDRGGLRRTLVPPLVQSRACSGIRPRSSRLSPVRSCKPPRMEPAQLLWGACSSALEFFSLISGWILLYFPPSLVVPLCTSVTNLALSFWWLPKKYREVAIMFPHSLLKVEQAPSPQPLLIGQVLQPWPSWWISWPYSGLLMSVLYSKSPDYKHHSRCSLTSAE